MNFTPYTEDLQNTFNPVANPSGVDETGQPFGDWLEIIDINGPGDANSTADGQQEATLVGLIPANKTRSAMRWFLGFAYVGGKGFLSREMPCIHPEYPHLRASSVSFKKYIPQAYTLIDGTNIVLKGPTLVDTSLFIDPSGSGKYLNFGAYQYVVATVKFSAFRYQFLQDSDVNTGIIINPATGLPETTPAGWGAGEIERYTWSDLTPRLETISADGNSFLEFVETSPALIGPPAVPAGPPILITPTGNLGPKFPAPRPIYMSIAGYILHWYSVPWNYVSDLFYDVFWPANILGCVGSVNQYTFLGALPGTLLMKSPSFDIKPFWVPAQDGSPLLYCDITIPLDYFNPENGNPDSTVNGWQLMPWRVNGLWYACERISPDPPGAGNGVPFLPQIDFNYIFANPNYLPIV